MYLHPLISILFLLGFVIPLGFFLVTLQNTLKLISPENRKMSPGNVWFILIPFLGMIWQFIVVRKIAESINEECLILNIDLKEKMPTYTAGLIYCLSCLIFLIPVFKTIGSVAVLITWTIYWFKVYQYKKLLIANKDNYMLDAERGIFHTSL